MLASAAVLLEASLLNVHLRAHRHPTVESQFLVAEACSVLRVSWPMGSCIAKHLVAAQWVVDSCERQTTDLRFRARDPASRRILVRP